MKKLFLTKKEEIERRAITAADHIITTGCTIRECAKYMHVSKSTIHKDVKQRLINIDGKRAKKVANIIDKNLKERHIRGGAATKEKYNMLKKLKKVS